MKTRSAFIAATLLTLCQLPGAALPPADHLTVSEGFTNPLGFHDAKPAFSWQLAATDGIRAQSNYHIRAASSRDQLTEKADLWDSGKVKSDRSLFVPYEGEPLGSRQEVFWQIKLWDQSGNESAWSEPASFELGLLTAKDWKAKWIQLSSPEADAEAAKRVPKILITKAVYGVPGDPAKQADVAEAIRRKIKEGEYIITPGNRLAGKDPALRAVKSLVIDFTLDGQRIEKTVPENQALDLAPGYPSKSAKNSRHVPETFRREFKVTSKIAKARLYATARGVFEARINGKKVGDTFMAPGWTSYHKWIETITYDVTGHLQQGDNTIGAILGDGWYGGRLGWKKPENGLPRPWLLAQLEITYADGTVETITSDASWKGTSEGPLRFSDIYDGETYDARKELGAFSTTGFDDGNWLPVVTEDIDPVIRLTPKRHHPTRSVKQLKTVAVTEPQPGKFVFDLGQNIVGWPEIKIPVRKDETITMRFAEMLNKDGTLYTANYRSAKSTNHYNANGNGTITWHPTFTFHGFRYVELTGLPQDVKPDPSWVTGHVLHSDFGWGGKFTSSHQKLNTLQSNIQWGLRGNFLDIPTDCPQRDERLGWTGDAQVFAPTSLFNAKLHSFWASWLETMRDDQNEKGYIPSVIPNCLGTKDVGGSGWSDAATVIPWEVYVRTGDLKILADNFEMMKGWTGYYASTAKDHIATVRSYGDWLQPYSGNKDNTGDTPKELIGTAYFARSADLTARAAAILGKKEEAARHRAMFDEVRAAFVDKFFDSNGKLTTPKESQTGYLLALDFGLVPKELESKVLANLVEQVKLADGHLRTGFLGTPLLAPVLDRHGRTDLAYAALFKESYPSWFFSINQGATTMWERWNSYSHKDGFGNAGMNSFNHYAYGAIGQWMYERIAGLAPDESHPGYKHFLIRPMPGGPLTSASAELETPYGKAQSAWKNEGGALHMEVVVPPNTSATVVFPQGTEKSITINGKPLHDNGMDIEPGKTGDGFTNAELPAGSYQFVATQ